MLLEVDWLEHNSWHLHFTSATAFILSAESPSSMTVSSSKETIHSSIPIRNNQDHLPVRLSSNLCLNQLLLSEQLADCSPQNMFYVSQVISVEVLCFTKTRIYKATLNRKESYMHNSWKLETRNYAQAPCCFIDFNTTFSLFTTTF